MTWNSGTLGLGRLLDVGVVLRTNAVARQALWLRARFGNGLSLRRVCNLGSDWMTAWSDSFRLVVSVVLTCCLSVVVLVLLS